MTTDPDRRESFGPRRSSPTKASPARVYNALLGGDYNYPVDQRTAQDITRDFPLVPQLAINNHAWVERVVQYLLGQGVRQFLDVGSGIPDTGNVYEVAQRTAPTTKVVCVDYERVAIDLAEEIFEGNDHAASIHADMRLPMSVLDSEITARMLDFSQPVAMIWGSMLHFVEDQDDPFSIFAQYKDRLTTGSYIALSHVTEHFLSGEPLEQVRTFLRTYNERVSAVVTLRPLEQINRFFDGTDLVEPGLVPLPDWHPAFVSYEPDLSDAARGVLVGGVGRLK